MENTEVTYNDEVVADSEDEDSGFPAFLAGRFTAGTVDTPKSSSIATFATTNHHQIGVASSISNFTTGPSAIDYASTIKSTEHGNQDNRDAEKSITLHTGTYGDWGIPTSIADRAKTRQRPRKSDAFTSVNVDTIELTSDEDDYTEKPTKTRPKPKPKPRPKAKEKDTERTTEQNAIPNMSMEHDQPEPAVADCSRAKPKPKVKPSTPAGEAMQELDQQALIPSAKAPSIPNAQSEAPTRPRPKPKLRTVMKHPDPFNDLPYSNPPIQCASTPPSITPEIPIATSQPRPPTSQLPPSDPPMPSFSTTHGDDPNIRLPPVDYLGDSPLSSPNSLFNENSAAKKRKRYSPETDEVDELATSQSGAGRVYRVPHIYNSPPRGPPPPTFFAGSSASSIGRDRETAAAATALARKDMDFDDTFEMEAEPPAPAPDIVDLTVLPPTMVPTAKPKKSKKKIVDLSMYDEPTENILDQDDQDEDFDPRGEGSSKKKNTAKKAKADKSIKSKNKAKKVTDTPDISAGKPTMEVVINVRPQSKGKAKEETTVDKGKQKATSSNKEVFKSSEFVESDDELNFFQDAADAGGPCINGPSTLANVASPALGSLSSKECQQSPQQRSPAPSILDSQMPKTGPSTSKRASAAPKKKRKSIVNSEAEDDEFGFDAEHVMDETPSKKRKTEDAPSKGRAKEKPKGKKGKKLVLSNEDEPLEIVVKPSKLAGSSKSSKKVIHSDEEEDEDETMETEPKIHATKQIPKSVKENVNPVTPLTMSTPKPNLLNRPTYTATSENKTPLYAQYQIAPRKSGPSMSELIRRTNSLPGSPFATPHPSTPATSALSSSKLKSLTHQRPLAYSPMLKSSKSMLSKIAPLHPNRRTPPPPPPPPPPRKKSKKELEMEEKWEEEMVESVGGIEAWAVLDDAERREIRKAKWARELNGWDEYSKSE